MHPATPRPATPRPTSLLRSLAWTSLAALPALAGCLGDLGPIFNDGKGAAAGTSSGGKGGTGATGGSGGIGGTGGGSGGVAGSGGAPDGGGGSGGVATGGGGTGGVATGGGGTGGVATGGGGTGGVATGGTGGVATGGTGGTGGGAMCGDGVADPSEECDGADFHGNTCKNFGFSNPAGLVCLPNCKVSEAKCQPTCDGVLLEPGEVCDGVHFKGQSCKDFGFVGPDGLTCNATCDGVDPAGCKAVCGNGTTEPGEACDDGNVMNGDGCSSTCTVEGQVCADAIPVTLGLGTQKFTGTTVGGGSRSAACASAAPDRVYAVTPSAAGFLTASLTRANTAYPSVLYARTSCDGASPAILCADSKDPANAMPLNGGEIISFPAESGKLVYVIVDGAAAGDAGNYELVLDLSTGTNCQDPVPLRIEAGTPMTFLGSTVNKGPDLGGSCGGNSAPDVAYDVQFGPAGNETFALDPAGTNYNSLLHLHNSCDFINQQLGCANVGGNGGESLTVNNVAAGSHVIAWVDGSQGASGSYTFVITPPP